MEEGTRARLSALVQWGGECPRRFARAAPAEHGRAACSAVGAPRPRPRSGRVAEPIPSAHLAKRAFPPHKSSPSSRQRVVCCESPALDSARVRGSDESCKRLFLFRWASCTCGPKANVGRVYQEFWLMPRIIAQKRIFIYFLVTLFICVCYKPFKIHTLYCIKSLLKICHHLDLKQEVHFEPNSKSFSYRSTRSFLFFSGALKI